MTIALSVRSKLIFQIMEEQLKVIALSRFAFYTPNMQNEKDPPTVRARGCPSISRSDILTGDIV